MLKKDQSTQIFSHVEMGRWECDAISAELHDSTRFSASRAAVKLIAGNV